MFGLPVESVGFLESSPHQRMIGAQRFDQLFGALSDSAGSYGAIALGGTVDDLDVGLGFEAG